MNRDSLQPSGDACPACGGTRLLHFAARAHDARPGQPQTVKVVECRSCEWAWQFPLERDVQGSNAAFDDAYKEAAADSYFDPAKRASIARLQREFLMQRFKPQAVLDIGCGDGAFASEMASAGCAAVGLDPSLPESRATGAHPSAAGLTLIRGNLDALDPNQSFEMVTLWDVIEHVPDPLDLIRAAARRVRPGGWLVVETGNYQSQGRIDASTGWWGFQLDHRWYFAPPQLRQLLQACGLGSVELVDRVLRPWWKGRAGAAAPGNGSLLRAAVRRPHRALDLWRRHTELARAARNWPQWSGLEIMTVVARREQ